MLELPLIGANLGPATELPITNAAGLAKTSGQEG